MAVLRRRPATNFALLCSGWPRGFFAVPLFSLFQAAVKRARSPNKIGPIGPEKNAPPPPFFLHGLTDDPLTENRPKSAETNTGNPKSARKKQGPENPAENPARFSSCKTEFTSQKHCVQRGSLAHVSISPKSTPLMLPIPNKRLGGFFTDGTSGAIHASSCECH